ncbi:MAG: hypothetical protein A4E58_01954 [Syntrophorhabdus sp. PtaB.Bin006]|nr:MAG: hypothetical protein A4E58_01954 [Syntrophorhabdus sp. PtaB.Bin006]
MGRDPEDTFYSVLKDIPVLLLTLPEGPFGLPSLCNVMEHNNHKILHPGCPELYVLLFAIFAHYPEGSIGTFLLDQFELLPQGSDLFPVIRIGIGPPEPLLDSWYVFKRIPRYLCKGRIYIEMRSFPIDLGNTERMVAEDC